MNKSDRLKELKFRAERIWKDKPKVKDEWLSTVFENSRFLDEREMIFNDDYEFDVRSCPERYLKCEESGEYETSLYKNELIRKVQVSDGVVILRKNGLSYVLLDCDYLDSEGNLKTRRNKMPGGKIQTSDRALSKISSNGIKEHQIAVLRECQEELPWPVYGMLNGQWFEYIVGGKGTLPRLEVKSNDSFVPTYVAFHFDDEEEPLVDPSPESQQRFTGIKRNTQYWFSKALLVDSGNKISLHSRVISDNGNKKDVFRWMPITTNSIHMLTQKSICPERFLSTELPFGISSQLTPSPALHPNALIESMNDHSEDTNYKSAPKISQYIVNKVQTLAVLTGDTIPYIISKITEGITPLKSEDEDGLKDKLSNYASLIDFHAGGKGRGAKKKSKSSEHVGYIPSNFDLHNRHIQLLISRLAKYYDNFYAAERDTKHPLGYSHRQRKRIQQAKILDEFSSLHSYNKFSKNSMRNKSQATRHVKEQEISVALFKEWFEPSKPSNEDAVEKLFRNGPEEPTGMSKMLSEHKRLYSSMINFQCNTCGVEKGIACPEGVRKKMPKGGMKKKDSIPLREAMISFYKAKTELKKLDVDFSLIEDNEYDYRTPFSCKKRNPVVGIADIVIGTLVPLVRNEGNRTPHQFFGAQCPAPLTVQSNMYGSFSRTVHRKTWENYDRYSIQTEGRIMPRRERLLWEFITRGKSITTLPIDKPEEVELSILTFKAKDANESRFASSEVQVRPDEILSPSSRKWVWTHRKPSSYIVEKEIIGKGKLPIISPDSSLGEAIEIATSNGVGVAIGIDAWYLDDDLDDDYKRKEVKSSRCLEDEHWYIKDELFAPEEAGIGARTFCSFLARLYAENRLNIASKKVKQERRVLGILLLEDMLNM